RRQAEPAPARHRPGARSARREMTSLFYCRPNTKRRLPMSRTRFSSGSPRRRSTFRPQLEALEDRLPPSSLHGGPDPQEDDGLAEHRREADELTRTAAINTTSGFVDFATRAMVLPGFTTLHRTEEGISAHFHATDLNAGHAYTFWIVEVQPNGFTHGGRVAGQVVGPSGVANVSVEAAVG